MDFNTKSNKLIEVLGLDYHPIGVKYTELPPKNMEENKYTVCGAIIQTSKGEKNIVLSRDSCACPGGVMHIGLGEVKVPVKFLVEGEKLWANVRAFLRASTSSRKIAEPPKLLGKFVIFYPLKLNLYEPDLIIILANPEQACRLATLNQFWDGIQNSFEFRGSLCWSSITYPIVTGNFNITTGDITARRMENYDPNILIVSIPIERLDKILSAIDYCTAGTAKRSEEFQKLVDKIIQKRFN